MTSLVGRHDLKSEASSPYAPTGRNAYMIRDTHGSRTSLDSRLTKLAGSSALLLLIIKYWDATKRPKWLSHLIHKLLENKEVVRLKSSRPYVALGRVALQMQQYFSNLVRSFVIPTHLKTHDQSRSLEEQGASSKPLAGEHEEPSTTCNNLGTINSVLMYWFGQSSPDTSQKKLWMIASSSTEHRAKVDSEIANKFHSILTELSSSSSGDSRGCLDEWCDSSLYGYRGKVAAIVVLDQFSRHIHRYCMEQQHEHSALPSYYQQLPPQKTIDSLAFETATKLVEEHAQEISSGCMIPLPQYIFSLMPFRHARTIESVQHVQSQVQVSSDLVRQLDDMLSRFRKATNRRMAVLQDEARRTGVTGSNGERSNSKHLFDADGILETHAFDVDNMDLAKKHVVYKTIAAFLADRGIRPRLSGSSSKSRNTSKPQKQQAIVVSLSGGVDSMVIASVLSFMARTDFPQLIVYAVHIDYANRPESGAEAQYVEDYCRKLSIQFRLRRIDEVTRGLTVREDYERIAREIRYDVYRKTVQECEQQEDCNESEVGVVLGHHRGDLRENVLSNAHKGCGPLDLSGMISVSQNDGVKIYRPLLPMEKASIFDYSHTFGVPYFKDTTPHWSTRGKLRNKLLPLLREIYGDGSMDNLSSLAVESDEARALLHGTVLGPFLDQVEHYPLGISFLTSPWKDQGLFFWKFVLREALHGAGFGMFSDKSVEAFLSRLQASNQKRGWLQCRRDYAVYLRESDGRVFVFFPDSFPFRSQDQFRCVGDSVPYDEDVFVGPWIVRATMVESEGTATASLLDQRAVPSFEALMAGYIAYALEVPVDETGPRELMFTKEFTKANRPRAWKGSDLKVQSILPLPGNVETSEGSLDKDGASSCVVVQVEMRLREQCRNVHHARR